MFLKFLTDSKKAGGDIDSWAFKELDQMVAEFQQKQSPGVRSLPAKIFPELQVTNLFTPQHAAKSDQADDTDMFDDFFTNLLIL
jgi:hypothetical protein